MTQQFYETNATDLIDRYNAADMSALHQQLNKHIPTNSKVIDIGFGSGRDLSFLRAQGHMIYGLEPVESFVVQVKNRFSDIADHFSTGSFLFTNTPSEWLGSFDVVISIAVWMHLQQDEHAKAIATIKSFIKSNGIVVLSFSLGTRESEDSRHFEPLTLQDVIHEFTNDGFTLVDSQCTEDSLGRDSIKWATVVFKA